MWPPGGLPNMNVIGKVPGAFRAKEGRVLCLWGDAGWGELVRNGKQIFDSFSVRLVEATALMIRECSLPATECWFRFRLSRNLSFNLESMNGPISDNTKAILLLAAPLLARGLLLGQALETWGNRAIRVASRADPEYPRRFKFRLGLDAPPLLYGCGDWSLLDGGGFAVVGSRHVDEDLIEFAKKTASTCAAAGITVISGGAKGIDLAAIEGSLSAGGRAIAVFARSGEGVPIGNKKLIEAGAHSWPCPTSPNDLVTLLKDAPSTVAATSDSQYEGFLPGLRLREEPLSKPDVSIFSAGREAALNTPAVELLSAVRAILFRELKKPLTQKEIAELLGVPPRQASTWLKALVDQGALTKTKRPVRYAARIIEKQT